MGKKNGARWVPFFLQRPHNKLARFDSLQHRFREPPVERLLPPGCQRICELVEPPRDQSQSKLARLRTCAGATNELGSTHWPDHRARTSREVAARIVRHVCRRINRETIRKDNRNAGTTGGLY